MSEINAEQSEPVTTEKHMVHPLTALEIKKVKAYAAIFTMQPVEIEFQTDPDCREILLLNRFVLRDCDFWGPRCVFDLFDTFKLLFPFGRDRGGNNRVVVFDFIFECHV